MSLPVKKIYIDTKYKTRDSVSNSNFKFELPETLLFPENSVFYIDDVCIPNSWFLVEENVNDKLYVFLSEKIPDPDNGVLAYRIVSIAGGNYNGADLSTEIQEKLRASFVSTVYPNAFTTTYNARKNNLTITTGFSNLKFKLLTASDLSSKLNNTWIGPNYDTGHAQDMNEILGNEEGSSPFYDVFAPYTSSYLKLQSIRNIYIHSPNLGTYSTIGPQGERTIIKKVPVSSNQNEMIFDQVLTGNDFSDCSRMTLKTLEFQLKDGRGSYINFHGSNLSFSIIFSRMNPDS
jgi:hypothetical protein